MNGCSIFTRFENSHAKLISYLLQLELRQSKQLLQDYYKERAAAIDAQVGLQKLFLPNPSGFKNLTVPSLVILLSLLP